jgi:hypothetical protein
MLALSVPPELPSKSIAWKSYREKERHETYSHFKCFGALYSIIGACGIGPKQ